MSKMLKEHKHRFTITCHGFTEGSMVGLTCSCGERKQRVATARDIIRFKKTWKDQNEKCDKMHHVWHEFNRHFSKKDKFSTNADLGEAVEKWAAKYPEDVFICRIDDDYHMGSDLVFILHRIKNRNWGTTVVVIPQCESTYHSYFMYPSHLHGIVKVLTKINKMKGL